MITKKQLDAVEKFADRLWSKVGLDIEFTRHFLDRVNDARNQRQITTGEIQRLFRQSYKRYGKKIAALGKGAQAVIKDMETDINMPFVLQLDKNGELDLVAKTVMRKKDFKTPNQKFTVESGAGEEGTDALSYKYKKATPGQSTNGKTMKRENFVPKNVKDEDVSDFMGAVAQAAKAGKKEFKFGEKTYKVNLKKDVANKIAKNMDEAQRMKYDKVIKKLKDGEWDTSMDVKKRNHLTYTDNNTGKKKTVFVEADELKEADGWIAIFKGKKLEITKKDAKDLYSAKQFAINKLKVPKSKQGLLAIKPAYNESTDIEENIGVKDGRRVVVKALTKPAALRLQKKLRNKFSNYDFNIDKSGLSIIVPNEKPVTRYLQKQPELDTIDESIEEAKSEKELDRKSIQALMKNPSPAMIKQYGSKAKYLAMLKSKLAKLEDKGDMDGDGIDEPDDEEYLDNKDKAIKKAMSKQKNESVELVEELLNELADASVYAKLSLSQLKDLGDIFKSVSNPKGKKVLSYINKELSKRKTNEDKEIESELQEAAPFKSLERKWLNTKGDKDKQARIIKKHGLKPIISNIRPGAVKLGVLNDLKAKGTKNATVAGLDADGELIFVTNNPTKIYYAKKGSKRPEGMELEDVNLDMLRLQKICEVAIGEIDQEFITESDIDLTWTPSAIQKAYKKYTTEKNEIL